MFSIIFVLLHVYIQEANFSLPAELAFLRLSFPICNHIFLATPQSPSYAYCIWCSFESLPLFAWNFFFHFLETKVEDVWSKITDLYFIAF